MSNRIPYLSHRKLLAQIEGKSSDTPLLPPAGKSNPNSQGNNKIVKPHSPNTEHSLDLALQGEDQSTESEVTELIQELAQTHKQLATQLRQEGRLEEAITYFRQAIQLYIASGGRVLSGELVEGENLGKEQKGAIIKYDGSTHTSYSMEPHSISPGKQDSISDQVAGKVVGLYLEQAQGFYKQKQWEKAIEACQSALEIIPETADAYKWWGSVLQAQGKDTDAIGYYAKALQVDPQLAPVYIGLGNIAARKKDWQSAIDYYRQAIDLDKELAVGYRNLGKVLLKIGQPNEAFESRYQALNLEPNKATAQEHFEVGNYLWQKGWTNEAITCYRRAVRFAPQWVEAYEQLGDSLIRQGQWQEGSQYMKNAQELRKKSQN